MEPLVSERKSYMKHIILLSASFFGVFFAFNTSQVLFCIYWLTD